jgi:hypothetical protein
MEKVSWLCDEEVSSHRVKPVNIFLKAACGKNYNNTVFQVIVPADFFKALVAAFYGHIQVKKYNVRLLYIRILQKPHQLLPVAAFGKHNVLFHFFQGIGKKLTVVSIIVSQKDILPV